jgi:hypothetical protein
VDALAQKLPVLVLDFVLLSIIQDDEKRITVSVAVYNRAVTGTISDQKPVRVYARLVRLAQLSCKNHYNSIHNKSPKG